jgi:hypothetical protein
MGNGKTQGMDAGVPPGPKDAGLTGGIASANKNLGNKSVASQKQPCQIKVLRAEVVEVAFKSHVKVYHRTDDSIVRAPHWREGLDVKEGAYSKRPAVYLVKTNAKTRDVTVTVRVKESKNITGDGKLMGYLRGRKGELRIEGRCPLSVGEHKVLAQIKELPEGIEWYYGDMAWGLEAAGLGKSISLNNTRVEVFIILDVPKDEIYQNKKGVWVEALRLICEKTGVIGIKEPQKAAEKITRYCHGSHGLKYDAVIGMSHFDADEYGGKFSLYAYLRKFLTTVNCYDQAAALQALCGALGIKLRWLFADPFGFIKVTNLIGWGKCNNPFFRNPTNNKNKIVARNDPKRSLFGNHAFCGLGIYVLDACAGPHCGDEMRGRYLDTSIDDKTNLYSKFPYPYNRRGNFSDIKTTLGLNEVE